MRFIGSFFNNVNYYRVIEDSCILIKYVFMLGTLLPTYKFIPEYLDSPVYCVEKLTEEATIRTNVYSVPNPAP